MRIVLESDDELVVLPTEEPFTIHSHSPELSYSAFHMLASGLATCVVSVLHSWATNAELPTENLAVRVKWKFVEDPHRVGSYELTLHWPDLPPDRVAAAERVTELCAVHETFSHPPRITTSFSENGYAATGNR